MVTEISPGFRLLDVRVEVFSRSNERTTSRVTDIGRKEKQSHRRRKIASPLFSYLLSNLDWISFIKVSNAGITWSLEVVCLSKLSLHTNVT